VKAGTKISQLHGRGRPVFSFEFFPPKTDEGARALGMTAVQFVDAAQAIPELEAALAGR